MQQLTSRIWVETGQRGSNHGVVDTGDGLVLIDGPQKPSDTVRLRDEIAKLGELKYIMNTEPHGDHWTSNAYFDVPVVSHRGVRERMLETDMKAHIERVATFGPDEAPLVTDYLANVPTITYESGIKLFLGDVMFTLTNMPGHTPYQSAIVIEEEGVCFTSDNVFCQVQSWVQEANPEHWLQALKDLGNVSAETLVPGHGPVTDKSYLSEQSGFISEWHEYVRAGVERGMTREQAIEQLTDMTERYPMDIEQDGYAPRVMQMNVANLYDFVTKQGIHSAR